MLRIALVKDGWEQDQRDDGLITKTRRWFDDLQPAEMETIGWYRLVGTADRTVYLFKSSSSRDVDKFLGYWREWSVDIYWGINWLDLFPLRGLPVSSAPPQGPLYVARMTGIPSWALEDATFIAKLQAWFTETHSLGLTTVGMYKALGSNAPLVYVFTAQQHEHLVTLLNYWQEFPCTVAPAIDWAAVLRQQRVDVV